MYATEEHASLNFLSITKPLDFPLSGDCAFMMMRRGADVKLLDIMVGCDDDALGYGDGQDAGDGCEAVGYDDTHDT
jgi:hypothetical protein